MRIESVSGTGSQSQMILAIGPVITPDDFYTNSADSQTDTQTHKRDRLNNLPQFVGGCRPDNRSSYESVRL